MNGPDCTPRPPKAEFALEIGPRGVLRWAAMLRPAKNSMIGPSGPVAALPQAV